MSNIVRIEPRRQERHAREAWSAGMAFVEEHHREFGFNRTEAAMTILHAILTFCRNTDTPEFRGQEVFDFIGEEFYRGLD
jgi:hypothetical protein